MMQSLSLKSLIAPAGSGVTSINGVDLVVDKGGISKVALLVNDLNDDIELDFPHSVGKQAWLLPRLSAGPSEIDRPSAAPREDRVIAAGKSRALLLAFTEDEPSAEADYGVVRKIGMPAAMSLTFLCRLLSRPHDGPWSLTFVLRGSQFATRVLMQPELIIHKFEIEPVSRLDDDKDSRLFAIELRQTPTILAYLGETEDWSLCVEHFDAAGGERGALTVRNQDSAFRGQTSEATAEAPAPLPISEGEKQVFECLARGRTLRDAGGAPLFLRAFLREKATGREGASSDMVVIVAQVREGDFAAVSSGGGEASPSFARDAGGRPDPTTELDLTVDAGLDAQPRFVSVRILDDELRSLDAFLVETGPHGEPGRRPLQRIGELGSAGARIRFAVPPETLRGCLDAAAPSLQIVFEANYRGETWASSVRFNLVVKQAPARLVACIDFGTSASALWFGEQRADGGGGLLPLGEFARAVGGMHSEAKDGGPAPFVPSVVGLSSQGNWRAAHDPLSFGRLDVARDVALRLEHLDRHADVSLPAIAPQNDPVLRKAVEAETLYDLKHRLMRNKEGPRLSRPPFRAGAEDQSADVSLSDVLCDVYDELGGYLAPQALLFAARKDVAFNGQHHAEGENWLETWREARPEDVQVIVTHPFNAPLALRQGYERAARRFGQRFLGAPGRPPKLVPEAMCAAFFGIARYRVRGGASQSFACIDIGAGTFDASLVRVTYSATGGAIGWETLAHFGGRVGGRQLDEALTFWASEALGRALAPLNRSDRPAFEPADDVGRTAIAARILEARCRLVANKMEAPGSWLRSNGDLRIEGLLRLASPPQQVGRRILNPGDRLSAYVEVERREDGERAVVLGVPMERFSATSRWWDRDGRSLPDPKDPRTTARLLGVGVPAMLWREARRQNLGDLKWFITGRAGLWAPIYAAVAGTVRDLGAGEMAFDKPFDAAEMKAAVVKGAVELARHNQLEASEAVVGPIATVSFEPGMSGIDGVSGQRIDSVRYHDVPVGNGGVPIEIELSEGNVQICRCLPGLDTSAYEGIDLDRNELWLLFKLFGQDLIIDQKWIERDAKGRARVAVQRTRDEFVINTVASTRQPWRTEAPGWNHSSPAGPGWPSA